MNAAMPAALLAPVRVSRHTRECHHCGLLQGLPASRAGQTIRCSRCSAWLRTVRADPVHTALACAVASAALYLIALFTPMMTLDVVGRTNTVSLLSGPVALSEADTALGVMGTLVGLTTVLVPGLVIGSDLVLFIGILRAPASRTVRFLLRIRHRVRPWAMTEVYMLGIFVAYTRLIALAHVEIEPAIYALAAMMVLLIATDSAFDAAGVWERIGETYIAGIPEALHPHEARVFGCDDCGLVLEAAAGAAPARLRCPRCTASVHRRKPESLQRTLAWLAAAIILYVPANVIPVLTLDRLGRGGPSTIIAGVQELYAAGDLPLALLVFFASITVPCVKVLGLAAMVLLTHFRSTRMLRDRTTLFRVIDFIGRWSMIDVFMVSILVAVVKFGFLATVHANYGIVAFAGVVVVTLFAAGSFDPRLMWDAAEARTAASQPSRKAGAPRPVGPAGA